MLIESEQPVFAVVWNTINQLGETLNKLIVRAWLVSGGGGTHVHLEFESMKRVSPRSHLRIHKSAAAVCADAGDVNVMIDEPLGIDVVESALDQIRRALANPARKLLRLVCERPADVVDETH
jgi:hypothetical protein